MFLVGSNSTKKYLFKKSIQGKNLALTTAYFWYGHASLKRESFTE